MADTFNPAPANASPEAIEPFFFLGRLFHPIPADVDAGLNSPVMRQGFHFFPVPADGAPVAALDSATAEGTTATALIADAPAEAIAPLFYQVPVANVPTGQPGGRLLFSPEARFLTIGWRWQNLERSLKLTMRRLRPQPPMDEEGHY